MDNIIKNWEQEDTKDLLEYLSKLYVIETSEEFSKDIKERITVTRKFILDLLDKRGANESIYC